MGLGLVDDGLPTRVHPDMEDFLTKAREATVGQKIKAIEWGPLGQHGGQPQGRAFQVVLENGQTLVFFSPKAYGLGQRITGGEG